MRAPKRPVCVGTPSSRSASANASTSGSASSGRAAAVKLGRRPRRMSARSVNWLTTRASPPIVEDRAVEAAFVVGEDAHLGALGGDAVGFVRVVALGGADEEQQAGADGSDSLAVDSD